MATRATVIFDGNCGFCTLSRNWVVRLDWLRRLEWVPSQRVPAGAYGIAPAEFGKYVFFIRGERRWRGFAAWRQILLRLPLPYLLSAAAALVSPWLLLVPVFLVSPLFTPFGNAAYAWVARNRGRLPGPGSCARPI